MIHWGYCKDEIMLGLDSYIQKLCAHSSTIKPESMVEWKNKVLELVDKDLAELKRKV